MDKDVNDHANADIVGEQVWQLRGHQIDDGTLEDDGQQHAVVINLKARVTGLTYAQARQLRDLFRHTKFWSDEILSLLDDACKADDGLGLPPGRASSLAPYADWRPASSRPPRPRA